jgi:Sec-independent protein secretion pathway component TatC
MAFGVTFEVPVLVVVLVYADIVALAKLKEWRPYVIVGSFVVGCRPDTAGRHFTAADGHTDVPAF